MRRLDAQDIDVLEDGPPVVGLALSADCKCPTCDKRDDDLDFKGRHLARHLRAYLRESSKPQRVSRADEPVRSNLDVEAKSLGLGNVDREVLAFFIALASDAGLKRMTERFGEVTSRAPRRSSPWPFASPPQMTSFASAEEGLIRGELSRLTSLTPGDFAAVSRRLRALGSSPGAEAVISMLQAEIAVKRDAPRPVGF